jgi:hypothetical protein
MITVATDIEVSTSGSSDLVVGLSVVQHEVNVEEGVGDRRLL